MDSRLREQVKSWVAQDPDAHTRRELEALLSEGAEAELADRFSGQLEFGTAGLRGVLGGGPMRMNRAVVRRTSAGLAAYLKATVAQAPERGVVVGYDGRQMSREFAEEAASTLAGAGFVVYLWDHLCPTPLVAFAVKELRAAAGVMVTASHNPPEYNGYKVYWENGAQIIPPHDKGIAQAIDAVGPLLMLPMPPLDKARRKGLVKPLSAEMEDRYLKAVAGLALRPDVPTDLKIVYTAMHGVGGKLAGAALRQLGFTNVLPVQAQFEPDGRFPTVRFPNPEERGALDLSFALAREKDAEIIIANDPDADRLAVAVPKGNGEWVQLSGDQVGALLAYYLLTERPGSARRLVVTTLVSSSLLGHMAKELGVHYAETLTGFKWITNRALALEAEHHLDFVMGYEEALGYTIGTVVRDKDGISAASLFAELAALCRARGHSVLHYLEGIYRRFGLFKSAQHNLTLPGATGAAEIREIMQRLRSSPPSALGTWKVLAVRDIANGTRTTPEGVEKLDLPPSDVLVFELDGGRVTVRPSGTEPKIKYYFELREAVAEDEPFEGAQRRADGKMQELIAALVRIAKPKSAT